MIASLLWKDFRLNVPVLGAAVLLSVAPYPCVFVLSYSMSRGPFPWTETVFAGCYFSQWLSLLTCALLGGNAFAAEREDQSVRFLMGLPVRPADALFAKSVVALVILDCLWIGNATVAHATAWLTGTSYRTALPEASGMSTIAAVSLMVFGLSWLWSVVMTRTVLAALNGLVSCGLLYLAFYIGARGLSSGERLGRITSPSLLPALVGCAGFIIAGGMFLSRGGMLEAGGREAPSKPLVGARPLLGTPSRAGCGTWRHGLAALLRKDWRLMRHSLFVGGVLIVLPYLFAAAGALISGEWPVRLARASTQSLWLSCMVLAVWGGYPVVAEKRTGSDRFLYALPVSRLSVIGSKLMVSSLPSLLVLGSLLGLGLALHRAVFLPSPIEEARVDFLDMSWPLLVWQRTSLLFALPVFGAPLVCFGVAWLASARLKKPLLGIVLGALSAAAVVIAWVVFSPYVEESLLPLQAAFAFAGVGGLVALACVAWGCFALIRHESP